MCKQCHQSFCDAFCPNFSGYLPGVGSPSAQCSACGDDIYPEQFYYLIGDRAFCQDCLEGLQVTELAEVLDFSRVSDLIEELGGELRQDIIF